MKKIFYSLLLFLFFSAPSWAQLKGGVKGGLNVTDIIITNGAGYFGESAFKSRVSYHFGSYVQNTFSKHFGYQVEMLFSNKGYTLETDSISTQVSLNYLNWPLLLFYKLGDKLVFNAGIEIGLMVTGDDLYNNFDMGIDVGLEYSISKKLMAGLRYNQGFPFKMNIDSYEQVGTEPSYQHSVIQFYIGVNIVQDPNVQPEP